MEGQGKMPLGLEKLLCVGETLGNLRICALEHWSSWVLGVK